MKNLLKDRKTLYVVLGLVMVSVFTLTIAYASLNTILEITGSAEVSSADWDIRLANPKVKEGSVNSNLPTITSNKEASFSATLNNPGDFYEFSIDVVNNGSIDAMIESIEKTPTLTTEQAKFMNYIIEYENGNTISTKQLVQANSFVRVRVKVEFRKDISNTDLPSSQNVLNLAFKLNYVQSEETGTTTVPNNGKLIKVVSGDGTNTSDEICIGEECFYVISSTEEEIKMLAKYNLYVGGEYNNGWTAYGDEVTRKQDLNMKGYLSDDTPYKGTTKFSNTSYWSSIVSSYPAYVYDSSSILYSYVENYKTYLSTLGVTPSEARLITKEELEDLGCSGNYCNGAPSWVYATSYWSGSAKSSDDVFAVISYGNFFGAKFSLDFYFGCRPVIVIDRDLL